jgi:hypothetical protein
MWTPVLYQKIHGCIPASIVDWTSLATVGIEWATNPMEVFGALTSFTLSVDTVNDWIGFLPRQMSERRSQLMAGALLSYACLFSMPSEPVQFLLLILEYR